MKVKLILMKKRSSLLLLDFNGVISYNRFWESFYDPTSVHFEISGKINQFLFLDNKELVQDWMRGLYTSEEIVMKLSNYLHFNYDILWKEFKKSATQIDISIPILNYLNILKKKYFIVLISDNMDCFNRYTLPNNPQMSEVFDSIYISCEKGKLKRDNGGELFKDIMNDYEVEFSDAYYIDDSPKNIDLFNQLGGKGVCLTGEEHILKYLASIS